MDMLLCNVKCRVAAGDLAEHRLCHSWLPQLHQTQFRCLQVIWLPNCAACTCTCTPRRPDAYLHLQC